MRLPSKSVEKGVSELEAAKAGRVLRRLNQSMTALALPDGVDELIEADDEVLASLSSRCAVDDLVMPDHFEGLADDEA